MRLVLTLTFMLSYEEALDYIYSFVDYGTVRADKYSPQHFGLERMIHFLGALGNPQDRYPVLHVAGTKGKGSVAAMSASALRAGGYRTGFYTSPHLIDFRERVQLDGQFIPREALAEVVDELRPVVAEHPGLTHFELNTALAFVYFARQHADVAVIEVGLGGRLDATNAVKPQVAVIASLSYDHTYLLGNTLAEIAAEKGGIIKPGVPVVTAPQKPEALAVLERLAGERHSPLTLVGRDWLFRLVSHNLDGQDFEVWSAAEQEQLDRLRAQGHPVDWRPEHLRIPLLGRHQIENAVVAYAALQTLRERGLPLSPEAIRDGLRSVRWPGRFDIISRRPFVVLDGAHNRDSAQKLATTLQDYFPGRRVTLIFGASSDKDVSGMLAELLGPGTSIHRVILTQAVHPRALDPEELAEMVVEHGLTPEVRPSVRHALEAALATAKPDDVILACGSLFVVAEARVSALANELVSDGSSF